MKTLLVIAKQSALAAAIRAVLDPERFRVIAFEEIWQAEPLLESGSVDACLLDADLTDVQPIRMVKQIRRLREDCPILIFAAARQWEWEEDVYVLGVKHVIPKPVRGRLLTVLLERCLEPEPRRADVAVLPRLPAPEQPPPASRPARTLQAMRDLSAILTHSLHTDALLHQFLLLLREILGINRAAIFLRRFSTGGPAGSGSGTRRLRPASAMGILPALLEHFELSLEAGIGRYVYRTARILKNGSDEARGDLEIQKEFELLGAQVAIPILDRESVVGVAVFDGRLTGEFFTSEELALIFHLLEELGLAIKNSWLHDQLAASHETMADILNHLTSACLLVGRDLVIQHANRAATELFHPRDGSNRPIEFTDLPRDIGSRIFEAQRTGLASPPFKWRFPGDNDRVWQITVTPFTTVKAPNAHAVLVLVEDVTRVEQTHHLEIEAANLRLVRRMAEQMAHAIGNSLVPISTFQQLLGETPDDPALRQSLAKSVGEGVQRITRLTRQMLFLARDRYGDPEIISLNALLHEAFNQAQSQFDQPAVPFVADSELPRVNVLGDRAALIHALTEVFLNALQAAPPQSPVHVSGQTEPEGAAGRKVELEIRDAGEGFTAEAAARALEPFFSTKNVGLGLGLTVTHKILEAHGGTLEIVPPEPGKRGCVRISLPMAVVAPAKNAAFFSN